MRHRKLIPQQHKEWLDCYLERKCITTYPDLNAKEWKLLQGAYRQMKLKTESASRELLTSFKLGIERDQERLKATRLQSKLNQVKSNYRDLKKELIRLKDQDRNCQALTASGSRCTRPAKLKTDWYGVEIDVCLEHAKENENRD